jgi:hypothetical protein
VSVALELILGSSWLDGQANYSSDSLELLRDTAPGDQNVRLVGFVVAHDVNLAQIHRSDVWVDRDEVLLLEEGLQTLLESVVGVLISRSLGKVQEYVSSSDCDFETTF